MGVLISANKGLWGRRGSGREKKNITVGLVAGKEK